MANYTLRVASYTLRVASYTLRVASYTLRVASYTLRVATILCGWQPYFAGGNHTLRMVTYFANSNIILSENN